MSSEIEITTPQGEKVLADEPIAPILKMFWDKGITTQFSCSGHPNDELDTQMYILFDGDSILVMMDALRSVLNEMDKSIRYRYAAFKSEFIVDPCTAIPDRATNMRYSIDLQYNDYPSWLDQLRFMYEIADHIESLNDSNKFNNTPEDIQKIVDFFHEGIITTKFHFLVDDLYLIKDEIELQDVAEDETIMLVLNYDTIDSSWGERDPETGIEYPALSIPFDKDIDVALIQSMQNVYSVEEFNRIFLGK